MVPLTFLLPKLDSADTAISRRAHFTHIHSATLLSSQWPSRRPSQTIFLFQVAANIKTYHYISSDPTTFVQGAVPNLLENSKEEFFQKTIKILKESADLCWEKLNGINAITCPSRPMGSMFVMVKLDLSYLQDIKDDMDFCCRLAKEESVVVLPGRVVGCKDWLRITFAIDPSSLEDGIDRLKSFCLRHSKPAE